MVHGYGLSLSLAVALPPSDGHTLSRSRRNAPGSRQTAPGLSGKGVHANAAEPCPCGRPERVRAKTPRIQLIRETVNPKGQPHAASWLRDNGHAETAITSWRGPVHAGKTRLLRAAQSCANRSSRAKALPHGHAKMRPRSLNSLCIYLECTTKRIIQCVLTSR